MLVRKQKWSILLLFLVNIRPKNLCESVAKFFQLVTLGFRGSEWPVRVKLTGVSLPLGGNDHRNIIFAEHFISTVI